MTETGPSIGSKTVAPKNTMAPAQYLAARQKSPQGQTSSFNFFSLKSYDIYSKVDEDFTIQTSWGATLSIAGWVIITILVLAELNTFMTPRTTEHMIVDTTLGQQLIININISFHSLTCAEVSPVSPIVVTLSLFFTY